MVAKVVGEALPLIPFFVCNSLKFNIAKYTINKYYILVICFCMVILSLASLLSKDAELNVYF